MASGKTTGDDGTDDLLYVAIFDSPFVRPSGGRPVPVSALQEITFLTYLVSAQAGSVVVDDLADEYWPDGRPATWRQIISMLATNLRKKATDPDFAPWDGRGYRLHARPELVATDLQEIHEFINKATRALGEGKLAEAEKLGLRATKLFGDGLRVSDYWNYESLGASALHLWARALLEQDRYLECATTLNRRVRKQFELHAALWIDLLKAWLGAGNRRAALQAVMDAGDEDALGEKDPAYEEMRELFRQRAT